MKKPKQPDRWDRMVLKELRKRSAPDDFAIWMNGPDIAALLRREHRAVVRMVQNLKREFQDLAHDAAKDGLDPYGWDLRKEACLEILAKLKQRGQ